MFILGLVLPERAMAFQQFVDHAAKTEPIGAAVIAHALTKNLRGHVTVRSNAGVWLLFAVK